MANSFLKDWDKLNKQYQEELRALIKKTGKSQRELSKLTEYFQLRDGDRQSGLSEPTFSRTLQNIPTKNGVYNLMTVLGVLYLLGQIDLSRIEKIIEKYEIPVPGEDSWDRIFEQIELGVQRGREAVVRLDNSVPAVPQDVTQKRSRSLPKWFHPLPVIAVVIVTLGLISVALFTRNNSSQNSRVDCQTRVPETSPLFLPDQGFSQFQAVSNLPSSSVLSNNIRTIGLNEDGVWVGYRPVVGSMDRVSLYTKDGTQNYWIHPCLGIDLLASQNVNDFAFMDRRIYIATDGAGIGEFQGNQWRFYNQNDGLPSNKVYALTVDEYGGLWAATYEGVVRLSQGAWETVYRAGENELVSNHVIDFLEDEEGNRWFTTLNRGIGRLSPDNQWYSYYANDPNLNEVRGVTTDLNQGVWFNTEKGGVLYFHQNRWSIFNVANGQLPSDTVHDVEMDKLGRVWVATAGGLVYTDDFGQTWHFHSSMDTLGVKFGCQNCLYDENHMWLVLNNQGLGHVRIPPQQPTIEFVSTPEPVVLEPGEQYIFSVSINH